MNRDHHVKAEMMKATKNSTCASNRILATTGGADKLSSFTKKMPKAISPTISRPTTTSTGG